MSAGPAAVGMRCSTQIVTCSNLCLDVISPALPGGKPVTSIEQRDAQSVLAGIDDLLPLIAKRAQATEDLRRMPDETVAELDEVGFFKLLQPEQWGGLQCDPTVVLRGGAPARAARAVPPAGSARSSACTTGTWRCSTSRRRTRCGARIRPSGCPRPTRRWARAPSSTAATWSAAHGTGRRDATTPRGRSSAARSSRTASPSTSAAS